MDEEFWLAICFGIFITLFGRFIIRAIINYLTTQQLIISDKLSSTDQSYTKIKNELSQLQSSYENLDEEINKIKATAVLATEHLLNIKQQEFEELLMRRQQQFKTQYTLEVTRVKVELQHNLRLQLAAQLTTHYADIINPPKRTKQSIAD